jgi:hypothetical protein
MLKLFSLFSETFSYLESRFQEGFTEFAKNYKKKYKMRQSGTREAHSQRKKEKK